MVDTPSVDFVCKIPLPVWMIQSSLDIVCQIPLPVWMIQPV